jgi:hypothetical protein
MLAALAAVDPYLAQHGFNLPRWQAKPTAQMGC